MSHRISTLLTPKLPDVLAENDPTRPRAAIGEIFGEDCVFHEANGVYHGCDEIDHVAGKIKSTHPNFRYQRYPDLDSVVLRHKDKDRVVAKQLAATWHHRQ